MTDLNRLVMAGLALVAGCGDDATPPEEEEIVPLAHASKSSTIALSDDRARVAMVNPDDGSLSVFQTSDNSRLSKIATGVAKASRARNHAPAAFGFTYPR